MKDSNIIKEFACEIKKILGESLDKIIVYGSYARGDHSENSDIDVMLLVSLSEDEIKKFFNSISDCSFEFLLKYKVDISPLVINTEHFNYWSDDLPFYRNVREEGVELIA